MIRITRRDDGDGIGRLAIDGRIAGEDVAAAAAAIEAVASEASPVVVDLAGVTFVDGEGARVLRNFERRGVMSIGRSAFVEELLSDAGAADAPESVADASEARLVERLRRGDDAAFEELVREHGGRMLVVARRFLRIEDDARDAVQEAFLSAFRGIESFAGGAKLGTWLHRIVVNAALMKMRSRRCRPESLLEDVATRAGETGDWVACRTSLGESPDAGIARRETAAIVRDAIDRLPETHRTVVLLRDIEELDTEETAKALGITPNAVKIRLHRARQALRATLLRTVGACALAG
jgi:RNA polymerase sigma-70 factor, ECF subfamily